MLLLFIVLRISGPTSIGIGICWPWSNHKTWTKQAVLLSTYTFLFLKGLKMTRLDLLKHAAAQPVFSCTAQQPKICLISKL